MPREVDKHSNNKPGSAAGDAALSICESLLIAMRDLKILGEPDVQKILDRASTKHHRASRGSDNPELHEQAAALIERLANTHRSLPGRRATPRDHAKSRTRN
jgi:hypothetical protein